MKKIILLTTLAYVCFINIMFAQISSDCTMPDILFETYERDITNMAIRNMHENQSSDTSYVNIPSIQIELISDGLAAIFNIEIPERDSIFNLYCVHDNTSSIQAYNGILLKIDTEFSWTQAWQNLESLTGDVGIDSLVNNYGISVVEFYQWSIGDYILLNTDKIINIYALIDKFNAQNGVLSGEPNILIGGANKITFNQIGDDKFYSFFVEFNDCFDGCDNYHQWNFKVDDECVVTYLGFEDYGFFGVEPLPAPVNCNLFTATENILNNIEDVNIFPNPSSSGLFSIKSNQLIGEKLRVYNILGDLIIESKISNSLTTLDLISRTQGIYIVQIGIDARMSFRIIKQ